jgi:hypothetical protein
MMRLLLYTPELGEAKLIVRTGGLSPSSVICMCKRTATPILRLEISIAAG